MRLTAEDRQNLADLMARIADGDRSAPFELRDRWSGAIAKRVRVHIRSMDRRPTREDVDGLVTDFCLWLADGHAAAWQPDHGAPPWFWADKKIRDMCVRLLGPHCTSIDAVGTDGLTVLGRLAARSDSPLESVPDADLLEALERLALVDPLCADLAQTLQLCTPERSAAVWLELITTTGPSPSLAVGRALGMKPTAVRKNAQRVRERLLAIRPDLIDQVEALAS